MVASLLKIISSGMQNERLQPPDDQPDLGAFKTVLIKTGRYGTQWARLDFDTMPDFNKSGIVRLVTQGELIGRICLVTQMPDIKTQQKKAYYTRKPIHIYSGNYTSINLYQDTDYVTTVKFIYSGGPFTGVQLDDLIPGGTYSLTISRIIDPPPPTPFVAVLTEKPLTNSGFILLSENSLLITGLTILDITNTNLYAYSTNGTTWTPISAPSGTTQGVINAIAYNGRYFISAGSSSSGDGCIILANNQTYIPVQPGDTLGVDKSNVYTFSYDGTTSILAGGRFISVASGNKYCISLSRDGGLTWLRGYLLVPVGSSYTVYGSAWSSSTNRFIVGGEFLLSKVSIGLFSLSTPNDPTSWTSPSFPFISGSSNLYTVSQTALTQLDTLFSNGQPLYTWNTSFNSVYVNYSSIQVLAYGSTSYAYPIFSKYVASSISTRGVYDLFDRILTILKVGSPTTVTGSITGTTLSVTAGGSLPVPCYITGINILRGTFATSLIGTAYNTSSGLSSTTYAGVTATSGFVTANDINISKNSTLVTITNGVSIEGLLFPITLSGGSLNSSTITLTSKNSIKYTVNISQTVASASISKYGNLTDNSLLGEYITCIASLNANFLGQLTLLTSALTTLATTSSTVTIGAMTPVAAAVNDFYSALASIIGNSQPSITVDTLNTILSNLITPSYFNYTTINNILAAKALESSYSSVLNYAPSNPISFQGSITGTTTLSVSSIAPAYAILAMRSPVTGTGVTAGTIITSVNYTYTTESTTNVASGVFTATNKILSTITGKLSGYTLTITSNPNNVDLSLYTFPLPISGTMVTPGTQIISTNGITFTLNINYSSPVSTTLIITPTESVVFSGSITSNNILSVFNASLASMLVPFKVTCISPKVTFNVTGVNPITYTVNKIQSVSGTISANASSGLYTSLQTLSTVASNAMFNQASITNTLALLPSLMQACDNVSNACIQAYSYYYSIMLPSDNRNFGLLAFLQNQNSLTRQYTQSTTVPTLFWSGSPSDPSYSVFNAYSSNYITVQGGQVKGIAVYGTTLVMVGIFTSTTSDGVQYIGSMMTSIDSGATWTLPFDPGHISGSDTTQFVANAIIHTGYIWVVTGHWSSGSISYSSDGLNWYAPTNPLNSKGIGIGTALAVSPTGLLVGGSFSNGSISIASGKSIGYTWSTIVRPTFLLLNSVNVTMLQYYSNTYLALGQWLTIAGSYIASIYYSNDYVNWSPATLNAGITSAICYSACTDGSYWVAVGRFEGSEGSIIVSDTMIGDAWSSTPMGPGDLTTGTGYACMVSNYLFFIVGSWSTGVLMITQGVLKFRPDAINLTDSTGGTAYCIATSSLTTYLIGGSFLKTNGTYGTFSVITSISITYPTFSCVTTTPISPNGVDFTSSLSVCKGIALNSTIYVAVGFWKGSAGTDGSISYSYDGITWLTPINPNNISGQGLSVTWNGTQFIATGTWSTGSVCISSDGIIWTTPTNPNKVSSGPSTSALWNPVNQQWLLSGNWLDANNSPLGNITSFSYGVSFYQPITLGSSTLGQLFGLAWDPVKLVWIAVGTWTDGTGNTAYEATSSNGISWSNPFVPANTSSARCIFNTVANLGGTSLIGGAFQFKPTPIQRSTDGKTWSLEKAGDGIEGTATGIVWMNSTWFMLGAFTQILWGQIIRGPMLTSKDGTTWNTIIQIPFTDPLIVAALGTIGIDPQNVLEYRIDAIMNSIAYNGSAFVATGSIYVQPTLNDRVFVGTNLYSKDGIQWSVQLPQLNSLLIDGSVGNSILWNGIVFVLGGNWINPSGSSIASLLTSSDGVTWSLTRGLSNISGIAKSITWNGYLWVAVGQWTNVNGSNGILTTSVDGINWTTPTDPTGISGSMLTSITWNGTLFSAVGTANTASLTVRSRDGLTWTYAYPTLYSTTTCVGSLSLQPFIGQPFDTSITLSQPTVTLPNQEGYIMQWASNSTYGAGTQYSLNLTDPTFTITASQRTQWLSYGSYYNSTDVVQFTLTKLTPAKAPFVTDLVGPHFSWTNSLGHSLIDTASVSIGGENVETIPGQLMEILDEFQTPLEKVGQMSKFLCRAENGFTQQSFGMDSTSQTVVTPLPFWFSRGDPGCVLPIDALNIDEVRITVNFKPITSLYYTDSRSATPSLAVEGGSLWPIAKSPFYYQDESGATISGLEPNTASGQKVLAFPNLTMPTSFTMPISYLLVEYIYLDKAEANRFRIADLQVPIVQHYTMSPVDTQNSTYARIPLEIPNPTRDIFFFCQRYEAVSFNAHFLASRDISSYTSPNVLWWPDASDLYVNPKSGFSTRDSEPIRWLALNYAETLNRFTTENVALFRSLLPAIEQRKAPWINRYYYNLPFGSQNGMTPFSMPVGQANLDKIRRFHLSLGFHGTSDLINDDLVDRFIVRVYGETYNIFRVYGGRGSMMFAY